MRLHLLGTGSPEPSLKRASSGYLLRSGKDTIVFDHGPGAHHRLLQLGLLPTDVTHVFISHLHYDHCADLVRLFLSHWDMGSGKIPAMKIYGPPGLQAFVDRLFGPEGAFAFDLRARIEHLSSQKYFEARGGKLPRLWPSTQVTELAEDQVVTGDGWTVRSKQVQHVEPFLTCLGFRLEAADGVVTYSGDTGPCEAMRDLAREADVLIHMCVRIDHMPKDAAAMPYRALAELARDSRVRTLVATHFNPRTDQDGVREQLISEMGAIFKGRLIWGEDLMEVPVRTN